MPTLNAFDNGDIRTTVIIFYGNRVDDVRLQGGVINTLQARMGTGGNNMPMLMRMREGKPGGGKGPLISDDKSLTIATANDQTLLNEGTVRRLTPVECERLQGFPDDWTAGQSDSARYKQMGNAVAVPVVEWLIQNIVDVAKVS
jgi:DNA (cytosine-5)-methyltransferase 1